jgi:hypothetical protein
LTLEEVAWSYRADAETGDQRALTMVQVLRDLNLALDEDPAVAETWLRPARGYLIDKRPDAIRGHRARDAPALRGGKEKVRSFLSYLREHR